MSIGKLQRLVEIADKYGYGAGLYAVGKAMGFTSLHRKLVVEGLRLRNSDELVLREIQGSKMYLDLSDPGISTELILAGVHEMRLTELMVSELEPGMKVVDIGANLGYYALLQASIVGDAGHVYAIEPVPKNFDLLRRNIQLNGYKNVTAYCTAISSRSGTADMALTDASNWGTFLDTSSSEVSPYVKNKMERLTREVIAVDVVSLDEFLESEGVDCVNLIRMDLEGFELEVLQGMVHTLRNTPPPLKLFIELHNKHFAEPRDTVGVALQDLYSVGFVPRAAVVPGMILRDLGGSEFIDVVCSHRDQCLNVLLEKPTE